MVNKDVIYIGHMIMPLFGYSVMLDLLMPSTPVSEPTLNNGRLNCSFMHAVIDGEICNYRLYYFGDCTAVL